MDGWDDRYLAHCQVLVLQNVFGKMGKGAGRGTQRVLPWHGYGSEYSQGTAEGMEMVMCD
jgi:hypothetical protein